MRFEYDEEEAMLQKSIGSFFEKYCPIAKAREYSETRWMHTSIQRQLGDQGVLGILSPGGPRGDSPEGIVYAAIVAMEAGKKLLPYPLLENIAANYAAKAIGCSPAFIEANEAGETLFTIAWDAHGHEIATKRAGDDLVLNGRFSTVPFADAANHVLVRLPSPVDEAGGKSDAFAFLSTASDAVTVKEMYSLDGTYPVYELQVTDYVLRGESLPKDGHRLSFRHVKQIADLLLAAEMAGGAEETLKQTVAYTKVRKQFGVEIAKFQSVKHMAADMYLLVESAKTAVQYAAWAMETRQDDADMAVLIAKSYTSDAFIKVAELGIQLHGGIGFTWEHDMHMFLKRAHRSASMLGPAYEQREEIASNIWDERSIIK